MTTCRTTGLATQHLRGQTLRARVEFTDPEAITDDNPDGYVDPDVVRVLLNHPGDSPATETFLYGTDEEVVREETGRYYMLWKADDVGEWSTRWEGEGTYDAVAEATTRIRASKVLP